MAVCTAQVRLARMQAQVLVGPLLGSGWYFQHTVGAP